MKALAVLALLGLLAPALAQTFPFSKANKSDIVLSTAKLFSPLIPTTDADKLDAAQAIDSACWGVDASGNLIIAGGFYNYGNAAKASEAILSKTIYGYRPKDQATGSTAQGVWYKAKVTSGTFPGLGQAAGAMFGNKLYCLGGMTQNWVSPAPSPVLNKDTLYIITTSFTGGRGAGVLTATVDAVAVPAAAQSAYARYDHRAVVYAKLDKAGTTTAQLFAIGGVTDAGFLPATSFVSFTATVPGSNSTAAPSVVQTTVAMPPWQSSSGTNATLSCTATVTCPNVTMYAGAFFISYPKSDVTAVPKIVLYGGISSVGPNYNWIANGSFSLYDINSDSWSSIKASPTPKFGWGVVATDATGSNVVALGGYQANSEFLRTDGTEIYILTTDSANTPTGWATAPVSLQAGRSSGAAMWSDPYNGNLLAIGGSYQLKGETFPTYVPVEKGIEKFTATVDVPLATISSNILTTPLTLNTDNFVTMTVTEDDGTVIVLKVKPVWGQVGLLLVDLTPYGGSVDVYHAKIVQPYCSRTLPLTLRNKHGFNANANGKFRMYPGMISCTSFKAADIPKARRLRQRHAQRALLQTPSGTQVAIIMTISADPANSGCGSLTTALKAAIADPTSLLVGLDLQAATAVTKCAYVPTTVSPPLSAAARASPLALVLSAILGLALLLAL